MGTGLNGGGLHPFSREAMNMSVPPRGLRDWFAGQALASVFGRAVENGITGFPNETQGEAVVRLCYEAADAMLAARAKGGGK